LAMLPSNVKLRVIGYETLGHPTYVQELQNLADELGITNQLEVIAPMPRYELLKQCRDCDVGLAFMPIKNNNDINLEWMIGASNKPFDYLACGLALLVSDLPEWKQMYVEAGYALTCNPEEPESIAAVLKWYLDHPVEMREMGNRGQQRILKKWNYEVQFSPVMELMQINL
jgi:glycosyltransferase involved in cell wall biosynthesis